MTNRSSKKARALSALCDFCLLVLAFWIAGLLRKWIPLGQQFYMQDIVDYFPIALVYAVVMVLVYYTMGGYRSQHCRRILKEGIDVALSNLIGFALVATVLYVLRLSQFSRLLLIYFYILTTGIVLCKRVLLDRMATARERNRNRKTTVLLLGGGATAQRYYRDVLQKRAPLLQYAGYLADKCDPNLPGYLGTPEKLHTVLEQCDVDIIIVAQENQRAAQLRMIVATADTYSIRVSVIPVYNEFVSARSQVRVEAGLRLVDVQMLDRCNIMGLDIVVTDMAKTLGLIETKLEEWRGKYICVANVHTTVMAHDNFSYREVQQAAVMALPDGAPLSAYSREHGYAEAQRVTGPDLMHEVLKISVGKGWRHYFYGSTQETLDILKKKLQEEYPGIEIVGMYSPPFRELTPQEDAACIKKINEAKPDFVWVGLGAPKQEIWMAAHEDRVNALMIGVGAAFDYGAGNIKRAPMWMQKHSLEWLYRLVQDPKRLFKRYFTTNIKYLLWKWRQS